jgi:RHS repeat-associated protein
MTERRTATTGNRGTTYFYDVTSDLTSRFTGYFRDSETGNDYAINRYEQPGMGRFLTPDPYMNSAGVRDPGSWNRYAYTRGDPVNRRDPRGTCDQSADTDKSVTVCGDDDDDEDPGPQGPGGGGGGGAAGGSAVQPNVLPGNNYTPVQMQALTNGFNNALSDLQTNGPCGQFLGYGDANSEVGGDEYAQSVLLDTNYRLLPFGPGRAGQGAQTNSSDSVFINTQGAFFNATPNANGTVTAFIPNAAGGQTQLTFANMMTFQGFLLLHELGHQTGVLGPDSGPGIAPGTNLANSQAVLDNCFTLNAQGVYSN